MKYNTLGKTGLVVSCCGLGGGGPSRLGLASGGSVSDVTALVHRAFDAGVNLFDTAERNGTQSALGGALADLPRDRIVISTKYEVSRGSQLYTAQMVADGIDKALGELNTDHIDLFSLHGVLDHEYDYAQDELLPVLVAARDAGKIGHIGITEIFARDAQHLALSRAVRTDHWDFVMVGYNLLNTSAQELVIEPAKDKGMGVLGMFAFRHLQRSFANIMAGTYPLDDDKTADYAHQAGRLKDLFANKGSLAPTAISYRFVDANPMIDTAMFGTGNPDHLDENIACFTQDHPEVDAFLRSQKLMREPQP